MGTSTENKTQGNTHFIGVNMVKIKQKVCDPKWEQCEYALTIDYISWPQYIFDVINSNRKDSTFIPTEALVYDIHLSDNYFKCLFRLGLSGEEHLLMAWKE
jgi:hypothetical protein